MLSLFSILLPHVSTYWSFPHGFLLLLIVSGLSHPPLLALSFPFSKKQQFTEEELQAYEKEVAEMEKKQEEKLRKMEAKHAKAADTAVSPFRNFDGQ